MNRHLTRRRVSPKVCMWKRYSKKSVILGVICVSAIYLFDNSVCSFSHWQLDDVDGLHELIGVALFKFISEKRNAFPNATISQEDFWSIPSYKRAMVWVFFLRFLLGMNGQKQWRKFSLEDYKFNVRTFHRWIKKDKEIMGNCSSFKKLPEKKPELIKRIRKKGFKRTRSGASTSDASPPCKRSITVSLVSTDEDED